jgi:hypothetical protein
MRGSKFDVDPLDALLQSRKVTWAMPSELRERVLARAQSALVASAGIRRVVPLPRPAAVPTTLTALPPPRRAAMLRTAIAASVALVMGAVGAAAALRGQSAPPVQHAHVPAAPAAIVSVAIAAHPTPPPVVDTRVTARPAVSPRNAQGADPFAAEVHLLRRAQAAYSHGDFSTALTVLADHGRRFPRGHLAEEREALRVRSLLRSGRDAEAHRAAAAFSARFPRSVLLPRLESPSEAAK